MTITLNAKSRTASENLGQLRKAGMVPAVVYGAGRTNVSISVGTREFQKVLNEAGESGIVTLKIGTDSASVLIHEVTNDPVRGVPEHIDFLAIDITKPIQVKIPLEFTGVSAAVKGGVGVLVKAIHELEVKGLPKDIPHSVFVDISVLDVLDSKIAVSDLALPAGVVAFAKPTDMVALIASFKEEKEEAAAPIDFTQIEVEKKGKKEEEGAEAAAGEKK